jgi:hypothetical protein
MPTAQHDVNPILVTVIEGWALRSKDKWAGALGRPVNSVGGANGWKKCDRASGTKDGIEAVRLGVFTPPGSPFDRDSVVVLLGMDDSGWQSVKREETT